MAGPSLGVIEIATVSSLVEVILSCFSCSLVEFIFYWADGFEVTDLVAFSALVVFSWAVVTSWSDFEAAFVACCSTGSVVGFGVSCGCDLGDFE